jgi:hydrogenase large subunit
VGPLAQVLYALKAGDPLTVKYATRCLDLVSAVAKAKVGPAILESTLGRIAARAIRAAAISELALKHWRLLVENIGKGDTAIYNDPMPRLAKGEYRGVGFHDQRRRLRTGASFATARSSTTRPWSPPPGTPVRATRGTRWAPTRRA